MGKSDKVTVSRAELVRVMRAGSAAARAGEPANTCPYSPTGDANERVRSTAWLRGYVKARA